MNWQPVESSQIEAIGYDPHTETLGIKFPPNKKQQAAGQPGSEYHYSFVNSDTYQALMTAESIGSHFGKFIKPFSDKYPYTKIEPEQ